MILSSRRCTPRCSWAWSRSPGSGGSTPASPGWKRSRPTWSTWPGTASPSSTPAAGTQRGANGGTSAQRQRRGRTWSQGNLTRGRGYGRQALGRPGPEPADHVSGPLQAQVLQRGRGQAGSVAVHAEDDDPVVVAGDPGQP